jgi:hypothetical protein
LIRKGTNRKHSTIEVEKVKRAKKKANTTLASMVGEWTAGPTKKK